MRATTEEATKEPMASAGQSLAEVMATLTEDVRTAMEAMDRTKRLRRTSRPIQVPEERYYTMD